MEKVKALAEFLQEDEENITQTEYDKNIFEVGNAEYMVLTDEEADEKAAEYIKDSLWAFNTQFILDHSRMIDDDDLSSREWDIMKKAFTEMQEKLCESANAIVKAVISDIDEFISDAIEADGRGHFMSSYDGEENEVQDEDDFAKYYYIYRMN